MSEPDYFDGYETPTTNSHQMFQPDYDNESDQDESQFSANHGHDSSYLEQDSDQESFNEMSDHFEEPSTGKYEHIFE